VLLCEGRSGSFFQAEADDDPGGGFLVSCSSFSTVYWSIFQSFPLFVCSSSGQVESA
jgi:hypothetical protein